jgi:energy-coupling factor transport system ATP-binding protein
MGEAAPVSLAQVGFRHYNASTPLFSGVELELRRGDRLLITGASGSGKSTLLGLMTGLVPRFWPGHVEGGLSLNYARAGMVLQNPEAQLVTPTVYEEVAFALENRAWPEDRIRAKVDLVLERGGLSALAGRKTRVLSGGEAQRLSLACAIAQDPDILFLDEPTAYLDPDSAHAFFRHLGEETDAGIWVIVEHRTDEIRHLVNRAYALNRGGGAGELDPDEACAPFAQERLEASAEIERDLAALAPSAPIEPLALRFESLSHEYEGGLRVLAGLDGHAEPGTITAVMGPSGSGKTTFLKKLAGMLPTASGQAWFGGSDLGRMKPRGLARRVLLVPQNPEHFFLAQTIGREWQLAGADEERRRAVCRIFGLDLDPLLSPALLSEGEKRRLNLALAFLDPRPVLLLDEPSYGLDRASFAALALCLRFLRDQGRTLVLVTHAPELVRLCADRLYRLEGGHWREEAP